MNFYVAVATTEVFSSDVLCIKFQEFTDVLQYLCAMGARWLQWIVAHLNDSVSDVLTFASIAFVAMHNMITL